MSERIKITASHLARQSIVYLRQSSAAQVEHNRESTERQYALAAKAVDLGWNAEHVTVIDEDLGLSRSGSVARWGFARNRAGTREPEILIDDSDVLGVPAEIDRLCGKRILPLGRFTIVLHLCGAGLAQIDDRLTGEMTGGDLDAL